MDHLAEKKFGVANYLGLDLMNLPSIFKEFTFAKGIEIFDLICESKRHNRSVFSNPKAQKEFATFREEYRVAMLQSRSPIFTGQVWIAYHMYLTYSSHYIFYGHVYPISSHRFIKIILYPLQNFTDLQISDRNSKRPFWSGNLIHLNGWNR